MRSGCLQGAEGADKLSENEEEQSGRGGRLGRGDERTELGKDGESVRVLGRFCRAGRDTQAEKKL